LRVTKPNRAAVWSEDLARSFVLKTRVWRFRRGGSGARRGRILDREKGRAGEKPPLLPSQQNNEDAAEFCISGMLSGRRVMPFVAEFTTDGRSKMLDSRHAPDEDKDAIEKFEKQAIAMAEASRFPVHLQVLHNGRVVHSKSYGNADTREF
jgi:hypothetical protein